MAVSEALDARKRAEACRLIALARDLLSDDADNIATDYLDLALSALDSSAAPAPNLD